MNEMVLPVRDEALDPDEALRAAAETQRRVSDPAVSAWVSANAGTGKTYVLVQRILRLLLSGAEPQSLLCLTFTKNAAAEMEARVLKEMGRWAVASKDELDRSLAELLGRSASEDEKRRARCLFAEVIDAARSLPIMTIHSFCEQVLRRFPVEAGMPPNFEVLTDDQAEAARGKATDAVLDYAARNPNTPLGRALATVVRNADASRFEQLLLEMLNRRAVLRAIFSDDSEEGPIEALEARLLAHFGLSQDETAASLEAEQLAIADELRVFAPWLDLMEAGKETDASTAGSFRLLFEARSASARLGALSQLFLTKGGTPRKRLLTKGISGKLGGLAERLTEACERFVELHERAAAARTVEASIALIRLAGEIFDRYEREKRLRCGADFDDLIEKTLSLLADKPSAQWVLFQLDNRISHILVDEAQDTSAAQWAIVERLADDFFAGKSAREDVPTIFAVGDVKQSIYGFQGAEPRLMLENGRAYAMRVRGAAMEWRAEPLGLSFRSVPAILQCVDQVWSEVIRRGHAAGAELIPHRARRAGHPGLVEIWEPEAPSERVKGSLSELAGSEGDEEEEPPAEERLCHRIAGQIAHWLESGEILEATARPIAPGDILILLRKRQPMLGHLLRALRARRIPVAGADRIALFDSLAVKDLMALGDAIVTPGDDLALAAALKSPLFGLDDGHLFDLAHGRTGSLRQSLREKAGANPLFLDADRRLDEWHDRAFRETPFDFYHHLLGAEDFRLSFARRLGPQCHEAIDEFLQLAESWSEQAGATLSGFLHWLRSAGSEVKRDSEQAPDAVRIMTVHAAKGLEAPIVILADTCREGDGQQTGILDLDIGAGVPLPVWVTKGSNNHPALVPAKEARKKAELEESMRLLYVAMTRARDRLYIAGYQIRKELPADCWYDLVKAALLPLSVERQDQQGRRVWRIATSGDREIAGTAKAPESRPLPRDTFPGWIECPAPAEERVPDFAPSRQDFFGDAFEGAPDRERSRAEGILMHRLLQILPGFPPVQRARLADEIAARFDALLAGDRAAIVKDALALIEHPDFRHIFDGPALVETGVAAQLWVDQGRSAFAYGLADRVLISAADVIVIDYKTGRLVPAGIEEVPRAHVAQLGAYCAALGMIFPSRPVRGALIYTKGPRLVEVPRHLLDKVMADLRQLQDGAPLTHRSRVT